MESTYVLKPMTNIAIKRNDGNIAQINSIDRMTTFEIQCFVSIRFFLVLNCEEDHCSHQNDEENNAHPIDKIERLICLFC